ncbi:RICIN domain-containing protein [Streptomyces sp. NPDC001034]|uniref:RICIN domain-containing protein n=1 Tax=Streptomyces sp. NPDC001034 TaxID=3154375 RepID=UPI00332F6661
MKSRLRLSGIAAAVMLLTAGLTGTATASVETPATGGVTTKGEPQYKWIKSAWSGQCVALPGGTMDAGAQVIQWPCGAFNDHFWILKYAFTQGSTSYYQAVNLNSGQCLGVQGGSTDAGAPVIQWPCGDYHDHYWGLVPDKYGSRLKNLNSQQCLTIPGGTGDQGVGLIQWPCGDQIDQVWNWTAATP